MTSGIGSADVTDADAVGIVTCAMGTNLFDRPADVDAAVAIDDIMVANLAETALAMPAVDVGDGVVATLGGG